jgi:predicted CXXCH cytochrome family protein
MPAGVAPYNKTPGGDFGWLKKSYTMTIRGSTTTEDGATHGHNVIATDYGYTVDPHNSVAPGGGKFPAGDLSCVSCHDMHGKYRRLPDGTVVTSGAPIIGSGSYNNSKGNTVANPIPAGQAVGAYRLLAGAGYSKVSYPGVPAAVAPSTYNRTEAVSQTRVAYGNGTSSGHTSWGKWCASCHPNMHSDGHYVHPVDQGMSGNMANVYSKYVNSSNTTGGVFAGDQAKMGPFSSLIPFVQNTGDYTQLGEKALNDGSAPALTGPTSGDQVSCLSCHRAHASGFPEALRWQMEGEFVTYADAANNPIWPGIDNAAPAQFARGRTAAETKAAYYDRDAKVFGAYQRVLCNKCHAKD